MTQQKTLLTANEFFDFCDRNDGRYELVDGRGGGNGPREQNTRQNGSAT